MRHVTVLTVFWPFLVAVTAMLACGGGGSREGDSERDGGTVVDARVSDSPRDSPGRSDGKPDSRVDLDASGPNEAAKEPEAEAADAPSHDDASHDASRDVKSATPDASDGGVPSGLHVQSGTGGSPGHIVDGENHVVQLHGVDRSGTEFACSYEAGGDESAGFPGFFDGPNDQTGVSAMASWHVNAVRVPLNEDCWLGLNGLPVNDTAAHYQAAIVAWVKLLNDNGMVAVVDLHWAAPGSEATTSSIGQLPMADSDHAPAFWSSVATTFASNSSVIFDLFNEPYITDWGCWVSGDTASGTCAKDKSGTSYAVAGMATLLKAVRTAGAKNVVILGGLGYSNDFTSWVTSVKSIPSLPAPLNGISLDNVAASWHIYDFNSEQSGCPSQYNGYSSTCNSGTTTATNASVPSVLAAGFPVLIGETGISAYSTSSAGSFSAAQLTELDAWLDGVLSWMEQEGQSYVAWSWNTDTTPILLADFTGTPSPNFGVTYKAHLAQF